MNENFNLPIGSIGKVVILSDADVHYGYSEDSDVVENVYSGEEYFVYKSLNNWYLIGNNKWISGDSLSFENKEVAKEVIADIVLNGKVESKKEGENNKNNDNLFKRIGKIFSKK